MQKTWKTTPHILLGSNKNPAPVTFQKFEKKVSALLLKPKASPQQSA